MLPGFGLLLYVLALAVLPARSAAQPVAGPAVPEQARKDPLAAKQQIVSDRMTQLEDRMYRLTEQLSRSEPEQAKRLQEALRQARELLIRRQMDEVAELLDEGELTGASQRQSEIARSLEQLLRRLVEDPGRADRLAEQIKAMRAVQERIVELLDRQRKLKADTGSASTQPAGSQALADGQRKLQSEAGDLAREMSGEADEASSKPEDAPAKKPAEAPPEGGRQPAMPGAQNVERSAGHMGDAAEDLDRRDAAQAGQDQEQAIDQLERARRELDEALDQLRREQQEEILAGLESRFRAMLAKQLKINEGTASLDARGPDTWTHPEELQLSGLAADQAGLADDARQTLTLLQEEGTSIVFPQIVAQLGQDMGEVAELLRSRQTGPLTQQRQAEIAATLEELLEAVKEYRRQMQTGQAPSGSMGGRANPPLLPDSAELKLLRSCQVRVNRQTQALQAASLERPADSADPDWAARAGRLAERQQKVAEMARRMNERITGQ